MGNGERQEGELTVGDLKSELTKALGEEEEQKRHLESLKVNFCRLFDAALVCIVRIRHENDPYFPGDLEQGTAKQHEVAERLIPGLRVLIERHLSEEFFLETEPAALLSDWGLAYELASGERLFCYSAMMGLSLKEEELLNGQAAYMRIWGRRIPFLAEGLWNGSWRKAEFLDRELDGLRKGLSRIRFQHTYDGHTNSNGIFDRRMAYAKGIEPLYDNSREIMAASPTDTFVLSESTSVNSVLHVNSDLSIDELWRRAAKSARLTEAGRAFVEQKAVDDSLRCRGNSAGAKDYSRKKGKLRRALGKHTEARPVMAQRISMASITSYEERLESGLRVWQDRPPPKG